MYVVHRGNKINHLPALAVLFIRGKKSLVYLASSTLHECVYIYLMRHIIFNQMSSLMSQFIKFSINNTSFLPKALIFGNIVYQ